MKPKPAINIPTANNPRGTISASSTANTTGPSNNTSEAASPATTGTTATGTGTTATGTGTTATGVGTSLATTYPTDLGLRTDLYSGNFTEEVAKNVLDMSVGNVPQDLQFDFNGDGKITSDDALTALRKAEEEGNYTIDPVDDAPDFVAGQGQTQLDDAQKAYADAQKTLTDAQQAFNNLTDPSGLYTSADEAMEGAFGTDFNADTDGKNQNIELDKTWTKSTLGQYTNITADSTAELKKPGKYWEIAYPDLDISISTGHQNQQFAQGRLNILTAAVKANSNIVTADEKARLETA